MKKFALIAVLALIATPVLAADAVKPVDPAYMWDLSDLYASPDAWTAARDKALTNAGKLESYKGTLGKSAAEMLKALSTISDAHKDVDRLFVYASLKADEDVRDGHNQERLQLAQALATTLGEKTSWLTP